MVRSRLGFAIRLAAAFLTFPAAAEALPPSGFVNQSVIAGLTEPTDLAFLPNGKLLITTKPGQIFVVDPSANPVTTQLYMTLPNVHSGYAETGIMSIVLDPSFATNGFFYLFYANATQSRYRVSRFHHVVDHGDPASEFLVWEDDAAFASCCHWGGGLDFGPDGKLYLTTGDKTPAGNPTTGPQSLTVAAGKVHRFNSDGTIPTDNPFYDGAGPNRDSIWAIGLRNPFRSRFDQQTGRFFISENGDVTAEDIHLGRRGANYGWPQCEGMCTDPAYDDPIFSYPTAPHGSITAGLLYRGTLFPAAYQGRYFFADYVRKWIHYLTFDASGTVATAETTFDPAAGDIVAFAPGPDGSLYYANHSGAVRRITVGSPALVGTIAFDPASMVTASACTASTTLTIPNVTVGNQANRVLIATVATEQLNIACDSPTATYRGVAMTQATHTRAARNDGKACTAIFYLLNPPAGTGNVVATWPNSTTSSENVQRFGAAYVISGAAEQPPEATAAHASQTAGAQPDADLATFTPGAFVVDIAVVGNTGSFTPQAPGQTEMFDLTCSGASAAGSRLDASTPGIADASWLHTNANRWAQSVAAFAPALLAPPTTTTTTTLGAGEPIALDAASMKTACSGTAADTLAIPSVMVGSQANRVLVVGVGGKESDADCNMAHAQMAVSYKGLPMTRAVAALSDTSSYRACTGIFYLLNAPAGTGDVTIAFPKTTATNLIDDRLAGALVLYNVAQQAPENTATAGADALTNPVKTTVSTFTPGAWVLDFMNQGGAGTFTTTETGQTLRLQTSCGTSTLGSSTKPVAVPGPTILGWLHTGPKRYAHALAVFAPANDGPATTVTTTTTTTSTTTTTTLPPAAGIALDAPSLKTACSGTAADTLVIASVPVSNRANRTLVVTVGGEENDADCDLANAAATVTYAGLTMTRAVASRSGPNGWRVCNGIFYLHSPPVGTANVSITFPKTTTGAIDNRHAGAFLLYNVAQVAPEMVKSAGANNTVNPVTNTIQALSNGAWALDVVTQGSTGTFTATQAGQVLRWQASCGGSASASSTKEPPAPGTTSLGWSFTSPKRWAQSLAVFKRAN